MSELAKDRAQEAGRRAAILEMASAIMDEARAAERERCAKIAERFYKDAGWHDYYRTAGHSIAAAIRASHDR